MRLNIDIRQVASWASSWPIHCQFTRTFRMHRKLPRVFFFPLYLSRVQGWVATDPLGDHKLIT